LKDIEDDMKEDMPNVFVIAAIEDRCYLQDNKKF